MLNVKQGSCEYQLLQSFEPWSTDYEANAPITEPRAGIRTVEGSYCRCGRSGRQMCWFILWRYTFRDALTFDWL